MPDARHGIEEQHMTVERHPLPKAYGARPVRRDHRRQDDRRVFLGTEPAVLNDAWEKWEAPRPTTQHLPTLDGGRLSAFQARSCSAGWPSKRDAAVTRWPPTDEIWWPTRPGYEARGSTSPASPGRTARSTRVSMKARWPATWPIFGPAGWLPPRWHGRWSRYARCTGSWWWRVPPRLTQRPT